MDIPSDALHWVEGGNEVDSGKTTSASLHGQRW